MLDIPKHLEKAREEAVLQHTVDIKDLLYSTGKSAQYYAITSMGKESEKE